MIGDVTMTAPVAICGLDMVSDQDVRWDAAPEPPATPPPLTLPTRPPPPRPSAWYRHLLLRGVVVTLGEYCSGDSWGVLVAHGEKWRLMGSSGGSLIATRVESDNLLSLQWTANS